MFERFTDRARKVMALANQEAQRLGHEYIGTEHILLGVINEGSGVGSNVLKDLGVDLPKMRQEVEKLLQRGSDAGIVGKLPQTPRAKKVIEYAIQEARTLNHNYIGTEHILLGLIREQDGVAAMVLTNLGLSLDTIRQQVLDMLGTGFDVKVSAERSDELLGRAIELLRLAGEQAVARGDEPLASEIVEQTHHLKEILARMRGSSD